MKQCSFLFMNGVFRDALKIKINISICIVLKFSLYIDRFSNVNYLICHLKNSQYLRIPYKAYQVFKGSAEVCLTFGIKTLLHLNLNSECLSYKIQHYNLYSGKIFFIYRLVSNSLVFTYTPLIIAFSVSYILLNSSSVSRVSIT